MPAAACVGQVHVYYNHQNKRAPRAFDALFALVLVLVLVFGVTPEIIEITLASSSSARGGGARRARGGGARRARAAQRSEDSLSASVRRPAAVTSVTILNATAAV